jgi:hypothetical protein
MMLWASSPGGVERAEGIPRPSPIQTEGPVQLKDIFPLLKKLTVRREILLRAYGTVRSLSR